MVKDWLYILCIFMVLVVAALLAMLMDHSPYLKPGDCYLQQGGTIFRVKSVGKYSAYFTTDDQYNPGEILSLQEISAHLQRIDCPETLVPSCQGGQQECLYPHTQVFTPDTD